MFCDLYTPEGEQIAQTPWQRYPRPQLRRDSFLNLNGRWEFAVQEMCIRDRALRLRRADRCRRAALGRDREL